MDDLMPDLMDLVADLNVAREELMCLSPRKPKIHITVSPAMYEILLADSYVKLPESDGTLRIIGHRVTRMRNQKQPYLIHQMAPKGADLMNGAN